MNLTYTPGLVDGLTAAFRIVAMALTATGTVGAVVDVGAMALAKTINEETRQGKVSPTMHKVGTVALIALTLIAVAGGVVATIGGFSGALVVFDYFIPHITEPAIPYALGAIAAGVATVSAYAHYRLAKWAFSKA